MTPYSLIEDSFAYTYPASLGDLSLNNAIDWLSFKDENQQAYGAYYDFSVWPPQALPVSNSAQDKIFARTWSPFYQSATQNIWKKRVLFDQKDMYQEDFQFAKVSKINPWQASNWQIGSGNSGFDNDMPIYHEFFNLSQVTDNAIFHVNQKHIGKGKHQYSVLKINNSNHETWYESRRRLWVYPFANSQNVLIIEDNKRYCVTDKPIQATNFIDFLKKPYREDELIFFTISVNEFVYISAIKRPHSGHANGLEYILQLVKINVETHAQNDALIDEFGSLQTQTIFNHETNKKQKIKRSNFDGNCRVRKGHDDWWILNYGSNEFGVPDIAIFYNAISNETFKISSGEFGKRTPHTILFIQKLGRYLAIDVDFVYLMPPFDSIYAAKKMTKIEWHEKP